MPIKPENRSRYPANWPAISAAKRKRAGNRCEWPGCGAKQYSVGVWQLGATGIFTWLALLGDNSLPRTYSEARTIAAEKDGPAGDGSKPLVIVLTVAHRDHQPENVADDNLAVWCQRHHLAYDQDHHTQTAYMTRRARANNLELPL